MTITFEDKNQLIRYRLEQAKRTIDDVTLLIEHQRYTAAVNRIYYGMFYSLLALGLKYDFETSKHLQLLGWFNKEFIKSKKIDLEYGQIIRTAFENRSLGDYDIFTEFNDEQITLLFQDMIRFIGKIEDFISNQ
jgi:uncharacterized protein (UPF0332 family)